MKWSHFIELPIIIYRARNTYEEGKLPDECPLIEVVKKIDVFSIESWCEAVPESDFRDDNKIWTEVRTRSGENFVVNMPIAEFEQLLTKQANHLS